MLIPKPVQHLCVIGTVQDKNMTLRGLACSIFGLDPCWAFFFFLFFLLFIFFFSEEEEKKKEESLPHSIGAPGHMTGKIT